MFSCWISPPDEGIPGDTILRKRLPEWIAATAILLLGLQLARPGDSFKLSSTYSVLESMASEKTWAFVALAIGTIQMVALILNGFFPYIRRVTPMFRSWMLFFGGCLWAGVAIGFMRFNTTIPGIVAHMALAALNWTYGAIVAHEAASTLRKGLIRYARRK